MLSYQLSRIALGETITFFISTVTSNISLLFEFRKFWLGTICSKLVKLHILFCYLLGDVDWITYIIITEKIYPYWRRILLKSFIDHIIVNHKDSNICKNLLINMFCLIQENTSKNDNIICIRHKGTNGTSKYSVKSSKCLCFLKNLIIYKT